MYSFLSMGDFVDTWDGKYCDDNAENLRNKIMQAFDRIIISGEEKLKELQNGSSFLYASLHKSHMDYVVAASVVHEHGLPYPRRRRV